MAADTSSAATDLLSGTVAGAGQLFAGYPFDTVKVKLQLYPEKYTGGADAARKIFANHGPSGFFKGLAVPLGTVAAYNAVLFTATGTMERMLAHADGSPLTIGDQFIAGAGAGFAGSFLACPSELVKCRLQACSAQMPRVWATAASPALAGMTAGGIASQAVPLTAVRPGPRAVLQEVVPAGGVSKLLLTGMAPTLGREVLGSAVMFAAFEATKQQLAGAQGVDTNELGQGALLTSGGIAGIAFWLAVYPLDVIKSKIQTDNLQTPRYRGSLDCARQVWQSGGAAAMFNGFSPAIIRAFVANAVAFSLFETTRKAL